MDSTFLRGIYGYLSNNRALAIAIRERERNPDPNPWVQSVIILITNDNPGLPLVSRPYLRGVG